MQGYRAGVFGVACSSLLAFTVMLASHLSGGWPLGASKDAQSPAGDPEHERAMIECREKPLIFACGQDLSALVPDADLMCVLEVSVPRWEPPTVPTMLHALRLWGADAKFKVPKGARDLTGDCRAFSHILVDNSECVHVVGAFDEYLFDTRFGIRVLCFGDPLKEAVNAEGHKDQLLMVLGESGVTGKVRTSSGRIGSIRDLLSDSVARFSLAQELEFTTCAYARWLPPVRRWRNQFGQEFSFDDLAAALVRIEIGKGTCQGCHVPYALVNLLLADRLCPQLLSADCRSRVEQRLREISLCLEATEIPTGGWDKRWSGNYVDKLGNMFFEFKPTFDRISVTGHQLEWIALAPPELRPNNSIIDRAIRALVRQISELSDDDLTKPKGYLPTTHAARALTLMRGHDSAFSMWQSIGQMRAQSHRRTLVP